MSSARRGVWGWAPAAGLDSASLLDRRGRGGQQGRKPHGRALRLLGLCFLFFCFYKPRPGRSRSRAPRGSGWETRVPVGVSTVLR